MIFIANHNRLSTPSVYKWPCCPFPLAFCLAREFAVFFFLLMESSVFDYDDMLTALMLATTNAVETSETSERLSWTQNQDFLQLI